MQEATPDVLAGQVSPVQVRKEAHQEIGRLLRPHLSPGVHA